ncbi:unnamed protein product [Rhizophagus irregularis]|nr:unnamed protein product [Rhizophagus irregularis]
MGRNTNNGNIDGNNNNNNRPRQRAPVTPINYADDEAEIYYDDYEDEYEEEWEEEDEYEAYVTTCSRSVPYEISSPRGKRTRFSESQKEDQLRTQSIPPVTPSTPMDMDATAEPSTKRKVRTKMVPAPIENVNEFDIAKYISDLPCGLSIGQATAQLPVYRKGLIQKSSDSVFILGNNWMRKVNAALDWNKKMLTIRYNGRSTTVPVIFTLPKPIKMKQSFEYDDEEEYESEELKEAQIYMSDFSGYSTEESLEFNPWENEVSPAHQNNEDEELEKSNPAIYLAQAEM